MELDGGVKDQRTEFYRIADEVLHYVWDPIGVAGMPPARDEYQMYLPRVFALLESGATVEQLSAHLQSIAADRMGLTDTAHKAMEAAEVLVDWRDYFSESHA